MGILLLLPLVFLGTHAAMGSCPPYGPYKLTRSNTHTPALSAASHHELNWIELNWAALIDDDGRTNPPQLRYDTIRIIRYVVILCSLLQQAAKWNHSENSNPNSHESCFLCEISSTAIEIAIRVWYEIQSVEGAILGDCVCFGWVQGRLVRHGALDCGVGPCGLALAILVLWRYFNR